MDYAIRRVGDEKYLLLFKARQADAITGCFAEYSRLELKRAKSRQTPIREQLRQAEEQVKKQPQRCLLYTSNHPVPEAIWWVSGSKLLVPPFIEGFLSYLREYLKELEVM